MILVDTSVWIDFFSEKSSRQVAILESLIGEGEDLCLCGVVLTEVLQGIRDNRQYNKTKSILSNLIFLPMNRNTFFNKYRGQVLNLEFAKKIVNFFTYFFILCNGF